MSSDDKKQNTKDKDDASLKTVSASSDTEITDEQDKSVGSNQLPRSGGRLKSLLANSWRWFALVVAIILIVVLTYAYISTKNDLTELSGSKSAAQQAKSDLIDKVGKLIELPVGETPSTATVSDASKLQSQEFFANAKNGDKVLVYAKAGRAVLYRPSTNLVIEYSKVNLPSNP